MIKIDLLHFGSNIDNISFTHCFFLLDFLAQLKGGTAQASRVLFYLFLLDSSTFYRSNDNSESKIKASRQKRERERAKKVN